MKITVQYMMDYFVHIDNDLEDSNQHKQLRRKVTIPLDTPDDTEFTPGEILAILKGFNPRKAPGEDRITSEILLRTYEQFPQFFTAVYNLCLIKGFFSKEMEALSNHSDCQTRERRKSKRVQISTY